MEIWLYGPCRPISGCDMLIVVTSPPQTAGKLPSWDHTCEGDREDSLQEARGLQEAVEEKGVSGKKQKIKKILGFSMYVAFRLPMQDGELAKEIGQGRRKGGRNL